MASPTLSRHTLESYSLSRIHPPPRPLRPPPLSLSLSEHSEKIRSRGCRRRRDDIVVEQRAEGCVSREGIKRRRCSERVGGALKICIPERGAGERLVSSKRLLEAAAGEIITG